MLTHITTNYLGNIEGWQEINEIGINVLYHGILFLNFGPRKIRDKVTPLYI